MTIFSRGDQKIFFIHIPKTGGTSISHLLKLEGWKSEGEISIPPGVWHQIPDRVEAAARRAFTDHTWDEICTPSGTTGHAHYNIWSNLLKCDWEFEFTLVRNPYERLRSQARQILSRPDLEDTSTVDFFVAALKAINGDGIGVDDNHYRPQIDFIGPKTHVYRLEDEFDRLISDLKKREYISESARIPHKNSSDDKRKNVVRIPLWLLYPPAHQKLKDLYRRDFECFNYSYDPPTYGFDIDWEYLRKNAKHNERVECFGSSYWKGVPDVIVSDDIAIE